MFQDKVVIITGAGAGIGQAAALEFARRGARVVIVDSDPDAAAATAAAIRENGGTALAIRTDVTRPDHVQAMVARVRAEFGRVDILVNNAGVYTKGDVVTTSEADWDRIINVNVKGFFLCSKYAVAAMIETGGGVVVNVASEAGLVAVKNQVAYNVSKSAVIGLTHSLAVDFASRGVRANCICPGTTETPLVRAAVAREADPVAARRALEECRPLNRLGRPEEIAAGILALASDELGYATGAVLQVDGGYTAQ